jgi:indolepyruvate ferredoxin oxidoreductase
LVSAGASPELIVEVAGLPDMVRGYESIKLANVQAYRSRLAELIASASVGGAHLQP